MDKLSKKNLIGPFLNSFNRQFQPIKKFFRIQYCEARRVLEIRGLFKLLNDMESSPQPLLKRRYRLGETLGRGAFGRVIQAEDTKNHR